MEELLKKLDDYIERCSYHMDTSMSDESSKYWEGALNAYLNVKQVIEKENENKRKND